MKYAIFAIFILVGCGGGLRRRVESHRVERFASRHYQCPESRVRLLSSRRVRTHIGVGDHWEFTLTVCGHGRTFSVIRNTIREIWREARND